MPITVVATAADCLCGLAIRLGHFNCAPLRADPANRALLNRPLADGDVVTVPDLRPKNEAGATDTTHTFVRKRVPEPSIRFVHGSPDKHFADDDSLAVLNISNYRTNKSGSNGTLAFGAAFGFNQSSHADPDTFKVEAVSPDREGSIAIKLEALRPTFDAGGAPTGHEPFPDVAANAGRNTSTPAEPVTRSKYRFRTRYLRAVSDELDFAAVPLQTVLVSDTADGLAGDNDRLEILDQKVRASFTPARCAGSPACSVRAELPVGENRQRIRLTVRVFRSAVGAAPVNGATDELAEQAVRRRLFKWFRRAFAQANLSLRIVPPGIEFIDPPSADMITIGQDFGATTRGVDASGQPSTLSFTLSGGAGPDLPFVLPLLPDMTPAMVGAALAAALPASHRGAVFENPRAFDAPRGSCDVIISAVDGHRVLIRNENISDTRARIAVTRMNILSVDGNARGNSLIPSTTEWRRLLRAAPTADDRLDCYIIGSFNAATAARGIAAIPALDLRPAFAPGPDLRFAVVMTARTFDIGNANPFTAPHEAGHVLTDAFHTDRNDPNGPTSLMTGNGTSAANSVDASKRIADRPVQVRHQFFSNNQSTPGAAVTQRVVPVERLLEKGAPLLGPY